MFCKKVFWEILQNPQENTFARVSYLIKLQAWGKIFKNNFFTEHLRTTASDFFKHVWPFSGHQALKGKFVK